MLTITTTRKGELFQTAQLPFANTPNAEMKLVKLYPAELGQSIFGFGGAMTEASAYTLSRLDESAQQHILESYYGQGGIGYSLCRLHIQSCDFSLGNSAYVTDPQDTELASFTLAQDEKYVLPMVQKLLAINPNVRFLVSPWSPPAFMKTNNAMNGGGRLKPEYYGMWARIMARYVRELLDRGICIERITVQNEPAATQTWESCIFTAAEEREFACGHLRPALDAAGCKQVKILVWDHNKDRIIERADESLRGEQAMQTIDGIAFHWYTGDHFEALAHVRAKYPGKELVFTEGCVEYSRFDTTDEVRHAEMYAHDILGDLAAGMNAYMDWNLVLDAQGGPNHVGNFCGAPVMCDPDSGRVDTKLSHSYLAHFSRYIKPGARQALVSRYTADIEAAGFINPDGERILVLLNRGGSYHSFSLCEGNQTAGVELAPHSISTARWYPQ